MVSIVYDKEVVEPPPHFNVALFQEAAETALRTTSIKLHGISCTMGSSNGENYCSQIYRVRIKYTFQHGQKGGKPLELALIVKSIVQLESAEFLEELEMFLKEKITYNEVLPKLELLLQCRKRFGPKLYLSIKEPKGMFVFEDLNHLGFVMASREEGLDEAHCRLVVQCMAEFHAASMVLARLDPHIMDSYTEGLLSPRGLAKDNGLLMRFINENGQQMQQLVSKWQGYEGIAEKIAKYMENQRANLVRSQAPKDSEIKVLNHGDMWVNNMLFKYDDAHRVQDVIFIDYQLSIWGSPGIDLNYFFYTSLHLDVLKHKRQELLQVYHSKLVETLLMLDKSVPVPNFEQIQAEVHQRESYGFFANYGIFPTISQDKAQTADNNINNFADAEFSRNKIKQMFSSQRLEKTLRYTLPHFEQAGVFN